MNPNNIFVDTNILIGAESGKLVDRNCLKYLYSLNGKRLFISSLSVAQYVSVLQKTKKDSVLRKTTQSLITKFNILEFTKADISSALKENGTDLEDNIQYVISKKEKCAIFVTNNVKDYRRLPDIEVISPNDIRTIPR